MRNQKGQTWYEPSRSNLPFGAEEGKLTERVPKEHYPIVLCALRSALSDTATTHPRKIIGAIQCIGRPPQGESVTAADYQQPEVVVGGDCATALLQCILGG